MTTTIQSARQVLVSVVGALFFATIAVSTATSVVPIV